MLSFFLLLAQAPVTQAALADAPAAEVSAPATVAAGNLTVLQGSMMAWSRGGQLEGEVAFTVRNSGAPDRVLSIATPAGPSGTISLQVARSGTAVSLAPGDMTVAGANADGTPGLSRVTVGLTDLANGMPMPVPTTITVLFETAGYVTLLARPVSPAPSP